MLAVLLHGPGISEAIRPGARVAVVGTGSALASVLAGLQRRGCQCVVLDDPFHAAAELSRQPHLYAAIVLVAPSLYPGELDLIRTLRRSAPHLAILLAEAEQYPAMLAQAKRLASERIKPITPQVHPEPSLASPPAAPGVPVGPDPAPALPSASVTDPEPALPPGPFSHTNLSPEPHDDGMDLPGQLLTAEELRALLEDDDSVESRKASR